MRNRFALLISQFAALALLIPYPRAEAQSIHAVHSGLDGATPAGQAGGIPDGSLLLGGGDSVNLFSGKMDYALPLLRIGGRGSAGYTITLRIQQQWQLFNMYSLSDFGYRITPSPAWWTPIEVGYGPGTMIIRRGGNMPGESSACSAYPMTKLLTRLTFSLPDGTEHEFRDKVSQGQPTQLTFNSSDCSLTGTLRNRGRIFETHDGTAMTFISDADIQDINMTDGGSVYREVDGFLFLPDGTRYRIHRGAVDWISDRNGNVTSFVYEDSSACQYCRVTQITDPLRRTINIAYTSTTDTITYLGGPDGTLQSIVVTWGIPYGTNCVANNTILESGYQPRYLTASQGSVPNVIPGLFGELLPDYGAYVNYCMADLVPITLTLANSDTYSFKYNDYSELARVTLPTGGGYIFEHVGLGGNGGANINLGINRMLKTRKEFDASGAIVGIKEFGESGASITETRKDGAGSVLGKVAHWFYGNPLAYKTPVSYTATTEGREYLTEYYDSNLSTILKSETQAYQQRTSVSWWTPLPNEPDEPTNDLRMTDTTTAFNPGTTDQRNFRKILEYDDYNNVTKVKEYDFDTTTELREARTTYLTTYASRDYHSIVGYDPNATNVASRVSTIYHIRNVPIQVSAYRGAGVCEVSRQTYDFDESAPASRANPTQRLNVVAPTLYSADPYGTAFLARANATKVTRSLAYDQQNTQCVAGTGLSETRAYDILGNVTQATDALSHSTTFDFTDVFDVSENQSDKGSYNTWAFATTITNAAGQQTTAKYFYNLGAIRSTTDANNRTTSRTYDALGRVNTITYPDGGSTQITYNAAAGYVETKVTLDASRNVVTWRIFDGLGRPCATQQFLGGSASGSYIRTRTDFDGAGRPWRTTNPYTTSTATRCTAEAGEVYTTKFFDGLDRVKSMTAPDNSVIQTVFTGIKTTTTDPDTVKKDAVVDALGRLDYVTEDPGGSKAFTTYYQYDALGNLTGVCPGSAFSSGVCSNGRKRAFVYDSLSRLRKAQNPETGASLWATYDYDNGGNLTSRTDTRSITTTYGYDTLNRLLSKTYAPSAQGATVNWCYDSVATCGGTAVPNSVGRLISVSNDIAVTRYNSYDTMGRATSSSQTVTGEPQSFTFSNYTYDLAGNLTSITYPSGRVIQTDYDTAGRAYKVRQGTTPYAEVGAFRPHGAIDNLRLGWNASAGAAAMTETWDYNNRLQPILTRLNTVANPTPNVIKLEYFYCAGQGSTCTNNNGNMRSQRIGNDAVGSEASFTITQSYGYDKINRLTTFNESSATETNDYDAYGNRWATQTGFPTSDPLTPSLSSVFSGTDNRMTSVGYDGGGNQTQVNPYTLSYDAENRVKTVTSPSNGSAQYWYDGDGRRVKKLTCTGSTACTDATSGVVKTLFVYDAFGQLTAEYGTPAESGTQYLTGDHLGSTRLVTDAAGGVVRRYDYRPFGQDLSGVNGRSGKYVDFRNVARFTSKERDAETGLDFSGARYFSSAQGRMTSPDLPLYDQNPFDPQSWNLYSYGRNNPLVNIDPSGRSCVKTQSVNPDGSKSDSSGDDGDGKGCEAAGIKPDSKGGLSASGQQVNVNAQQGSLWAMLTAPQVPRYVPNDVPLSQRSQEIIHAIANAAPTVCGGGVYTYAGKELGAGPVDGFAGTIREFDSRAGQTKGVLFEAGGGEGIVGGVGTIVSPGPDGKPGSATFLFGGGGIKTPVVAGSAGLVGFTTGLGVYGEGFLFQRGGGVGAYLNITTNAGCNQGGH